MITIGNKTYLRTHQGVHIFHDKSARQFISNTWFDEFIERPIERVVSRTGTWNSPQNCHIVHRIKIAS